MLFEAEVKKILFVRKGLLLLSICLIAKALLLCAIPELKDERISLSQNQYNKYLSELYGENSTGKNEWIKQEYAWCLETISQRESMESQYAGKEISEDAYQKYAKDLELAYLHRNAAQIFSEKAAQFGEQDPELPPAWYIYEYGWQTVFTLQQFPDVFLLLGLLILSTQCFTSEFAAGMLPVLLSAKHGKARLYHAKLLSLLFVGLISALLFCGTEALIFFLRGWCNDAEAPIYSVSLMKGCCLSVSLGAGYLAALLMRTLASLLFSAAIFGISIWIKAPVNTAFTGLCLLIFPLLFDDSIALFTYGGLLCGSRALNALGQGVIPVWIPAAVVIVYSAAVVWLAGRRFGRGI